MTEIRRLISQESGIYHLSYEPVLKEIPQMRQVIYVKTHKE